MDYALLQTIIGTLGLITIFLLWWQVKSELRWKKINFSLDKIDYSIIEKNGGIINEFGIDMKDTTMSDEDYGKIINEQDLTLIFAVQRILDMFEDFAILYNMNVLNTHFVYEAYSEGTIFYYSKFKRIIDYYRENNDPLYYQNFEICANIFIKMREKEQRNLDQKLRKVNRLKQESEEKLIKLLNNIKQKAKVTHDKF